MSIVVNCRNCGRRHNVNEEHAGRKFRCRECSAVLKVPVRDPYQADPWETEEPGGALDYEDYDDYENYDDGYEDYEPRAAALPPRMARKPKRKSKPAPQKSRPKKRSASRASSGAGSAVGKIGGGLLVGLFVMGFIVRLIGAGGFDFGADWKPYTTPDGNITVLMPGKVKSVPVRQMAPGGKSFGAKRRSYGCVIVIEPMPAEMKGLSEAEMFEAMEVGSTFLGATNVKRSEIQGRPCLTFDQPPKKGLRSKGMAFVYKTKVYTLNYVYKGRKGSQERKYFDSVKFN